MENRCFGFTYGSGNGLVILFLYDIPLEPVGYVAVFEMLLTGLGLMWDYHKYRKKQESLLYIRDCGNFSEEYLEAPEK